MRAGENICALDPILRVFTFDSFNSESNTMRISISYHKQEIKVQKGYLTPLRSHSQETEYYIRMHAD